MESEEKVNILIVDDDPVKSTLIQNIIYDSGENIIVLDNGKDALRYLLAHDVAVILLDVNMPVMDGFETASLIRKRKQNQFTPILFITAYSTDAKEVSRGYSLGAVDYLFTPVVPEILRAKVKVFTDLFKMNNIIKSNFLQIQSLNQDLEKYSAILEKQKWLLEETNKDLESFSYSVSHDLRTPLRHIAGYTELLKNYFSGKLDEKGNNYLQNVVNATQKMGTLIDDLLELSRIGMASMKPVKINLASLVKEVLEDLKPEINSRNILWKIGELEEVTADLNLMKMVLLNYITNAVKYTRKREKAEIEIGCNKIEGEIVFFIKDNGAGFAMEYVDRLFGVFQRLHSTNEFEGTGIGLANVKKIISKHGGRVWAEGEVDKGACFYFALPFVE